MDISSGGARRENDLYKERWSVSGFMPTSLKKMFEMAEILAGVLAALLLVSGCTFPQNHLSQKAWSQTATREQQQQQLRADPQGDRDMLAF